MGTEARKPKKKARPYKIIKTVKATFNSITAIVYLCFFKVDSQ
jgi:hypothetical protein